MDTAKHFKNVQILLFHWNGHLSSVIQVGHMVKYDEDNWKLQNCEKSRLKAS